MDERAIRLYKFLGDHDMRGMADSGRNKLAFLMVGMSSAKQLNFCASEARRDEQHVG